MKISNLCIQRPVFATVLSLFVVLLGIVSYQRISVRELPDVDFPIVSIRTTYPGASAQIVDEQLTDIIEEQVSTLEGIKHINSVSTDSQSIITIEFDLSRKIDTAAQDVRDRISRIRHLLPDDIENPSVEKFDINSFAIMWLALTSDRMDQAQLSYLAENKVKDSLQNAYGVGSIIIGGQKRYAMRINIDPQKLAAYNLSFEDLTHALLSQNVELPSGRIEGPNREFTVKVLGKPKSVQEFNDLIVSRHANQIIRIKDIGSAQEGIENPRTLARFNGKNAVGLGIVKQSQANTIEVADGVKAKLEAIGKELPADVQVHIAFDSSIFVKQSIDEVKETLIFAGILVVGVIFLFLRSLKSTLIPAIIMPISIVATYAVMYFLGFTLNNFTLLALVLSIGVVVDDAIVVLENCYRYVQEGLSSKEAAKKGTSEVGLAVIATSVVLVAVFLPVAFIEGQIGKFFYEFGITVSSAIIISTFIAVTLTPMLCSRYLQKSVKEYVLYSRFEKIYLAIEELYARALRMALSHKLTVFAFVMLSVGMSSWFFFHLGKEFVPSSDRGNFVINITAPQGATLEYSERYLKKVENILSQRSDIASFFSALALSEAGDGDVTKGLVFVRLIDANEREHQDKILYSVRKELSSVTGVDLSAISLSPFSQGQRNKPFQMVISSNEYPRLVHYAKLFKEKLFNVKELIELENDLRIDKPQLSLHVKSEIANQLGVSVPQISKVLNAFLAGEKYGNYEAHGKRYDLIVQLERQERLDPSVFGKIYIRSNSGKLVALNSLVELESTVGPSSILRFDRQKSVTFSANLLQSTLAQAVEKSKAVAQAVLPSEVDWKFIGEAEQMNESFASLFLAFILSIGVIYLALCAQFESFIDPLIIMFSVPLALVGALGFLYLFSMTLNMYSLIGMIMLMGLVTKNAILLVDYARQLQMQSDNLKELIILSAKTRLRPILMTALSTIVGILPIALALGAGSEARKPLGVAVVGGMFSSCLLTLFVIPIVYYLIHRKRK